MPIITDMIGKTAMNNFEFLREIFDQNWERFGGTVFNVHPFEQSFSREFARSLTIWSKRPTGSIATTKTAS